MLSPEGGYPRDERIHLFGGGSSPSQLQLTSHRITLPPEGGGAPLVCWWARMI